MGKRLRMLENKPANLERARSRKILTAQTQVWLSAEAERQLRVWTQAAEGEFSCFGVVSYTPESGRIIVEKFFLPEQICNGVATKPSESAMCDLMTELSRSGYNMSSLCCWAHSHVNMGVFWSGEDSDTINQMENDSFILSIVTNKQGQFRVRLDLYAPLRLTIDEISLHFLSASPRDEVLEAELKSKVKREVYQQPSRFGDNRWTRYGYQSNVITDAAKPANNDTVVIQSAPQYRGHVGSLNSDDVDDEFNFLGMYDRDAAAYAKEQATKEDARAEEYLDKVAAVGNKIAAVLRLEQELLLSKVLAEQIVHLALNDKIQGYTDEILCKFSVGYERLDADTQDQVIMILEEEGIIDPPIQEDDADPDIPVDILDTQDEGGLHEQSGD